jgi:hypothetical protein
LIDFSVERRVLGPESAPEVAQYLLDAPTLARAEDGEPLPIVFRDVSQVVDQACQDGTSLLTIAVSHGQGQVGRQVKPEAARIEGSNRRFP